MKSQPFATKWRVVFSLFASCGIFALPGHAATCSSSNLPSGPAAYVATSPNLVTVLNASTNTVACTIPVGNSPTNLAVSPDGSQLFVENDTDATVSVIDLTSGAVASTIDLRTAASAPKPMTANLAVSPDGTSVYVVVLPQTVVPGTTKPTLDIISLPLLTVSAATGFNSSASLVAVTGAGLGIAFSPDATKAYVATEGSTYVVTTSTASISAPLAVNGGTAAVDPNGDIAYVIDIAPATNTTVSKITTATNAVSPLSPSPMCPLASTTAITPDNAFAYYTCPATGIDFVQKIDTNTNAVLATIDHATKGLGVGPQGVAITSDGASAYVANNDGSVSVVSVSGNSATTPVTSLGALSGIAFRPVQLAISPTSQSLEAGGPPFQFTSTLNYAFGGVTWSVACPQTGTACGNITNTGLYTPPVAVPSPNGVQVIVTSSEIPVKSLKYPLQRVPAAVAITPPIVVTLTPPAPPVLINQAYMFTARIQNEGGTKGVTFALTCPDVNPCGTLDPPGAPSGTTVDYNVTLTYHAPAAILATASHATVTATSVADPSKVSTPATLTITSTVTVTATPPPPPVLINQAYMFTARIQNEGGTEGVTFALTCPDVNPCGTLDPPGAPSGTAGDYDVTLTYHAPASVLATISRATVTATSVADPSKISNAATVAITSIVTITLTPATPPFLIDNQATPTHPYTFTATTAGDANNLGVTWSLGACTLRVTTSNPNPCGKINPINSTTGVYTAPAIATFPNVLTIQAQSKADPSKIVTLPITITSNVTVAITSTFTTVKIEDLPGTDTFIGSVTNDPNTPPLGVTWTMVSCDGSNTNLAPCGNINASTGAYTPPSKVPLIPNSNFVVQATSVADTSKSSSPLTITIASNIAVAITSTFTTVKIEDLPGTDTFIGSVTNDPNTPPLGVTWTMVSCDGSNTNLAPCGSVNANTGAYTPPTKVPVAPALFVVQATSVADASKSSLAQAIAITSNITVTKLAPTTVMIEDTTDTFTATVTNDPNGPPPGLGATWTMVSCAGSTTNLAPCGSLSPGGTYTPPKKMPALPPNNVFIVQATSLADTNQVSAPVTVMLTSNITVTNLAPTTVMIEDTTDTYTATVSNDPNTPSSGVTWTMVSCAASATNTALCGTLTPSGTYTPPKRVPAAPSNVFTVQATSIADPSKSSAPIQVTLTSNITVANLAPATVMVEDASDTFTATVTNDPNLPSPGLGVTWTTVSCAGSSTNFAPCGTITPGGTYTPPKKVPVLAPNNVLVVQASSIVDPNQTSRITVMLTSNITVNNLAPTTVMIEDTADPFTATVTNDPNLPPPGLGVTWTALSCAGSSTNFEACGTITPGGMYTPPKKVPALAPNNVFVVQATSIADPNQTSRVTVTLTSNITVNNLAPTTVMIEDTADPFTATVTNDPNLPPPGSGVTWTMLSCAGSTTNLAPCGTLAPSGTYTPSKKVPALTPNNVFVVQATSIADPNKSSAPVTVTLTSNITVNDLAPTTVMIEDAADPFTAAVTNDPNLPSPGLGVTWTMVSCGNSNNLALCGTLTSGGIYRPPKKVPALAPNNVFTVQATSIADPNKNSAPVTVTLTSNVTVGVTSTFTSVKIEDLPAGTDRFTATVTGDPNSPTLGVTWAMVSCGGSATNLAACGSINASTGDYTPPTTVPLAPGNSFQVQAISIADPNRPPAMTAAITIGSNVTLSLALASGSSSPLPIRFTDNLVATVLNDPNSPGLGVKAWVVKCNLAASACGTINFTPGATTATYNAPSAAPAGGLVVTVTATPFADPNKNSDNNNGPAFQINVQPYLLTAGTPCTAGTQSFQICIPSGQSAGTATINLDGPIGVDGETFTFSCKPDLGGLTNAACAFVPGLSSGSPLVSCPPNNNVIAPGTSSTTPVTLCLSVTRTSTTTANVRLRPSARPGATDRGLRFELALLLALICFAIFVGSGVFVRKGRQGYAFVLLLIVVLGWVSACTQFSAASSPSSPVVASPGKTGFLTVTVTPNNSSFPSQQIMVPFDVQ